MLLMGVNYRVCVTRLVCLHRLPIFVFHPNCSCWKANEKSIVIVLSHATVDQVGYCHASSGRLYLVVPAYSTTLLRHHPQPSYAQFAHMRSVAHLAPLIYEFVIKHRLSVYYVNHKNCNTFCAYLRILRILRKTRYCRKQTGSYIYR